MQRVKVMTQENSSPPQFKSDPEGALAGYKKYGFHIEHDVWSKDEISVLNDAAQDLRARTQSDYRPLMHPHRQSPEFLKALRQPFVVDLIEGMLQGEVSGLQTEYFFGVPGTLGFARHQDNFYLEADQHSFGSVWSAMTDVSPENGGLYIYPGTHLEPILNTQRLEGGAGQNQDPNAANEDCIVPEQYAAMNVHLPAGSVVVLHGRLSNIARDVLQLQEVGDFGDENCLPPLNLIRSTKLDLTTEPPISCSCC